MRSRCSFCYSILFITQSVDFDAEFPLDDGENAAVTLGNNFDAALFLCDEFTQLGLIHASLVYMLVLSHIIKSEMRAKASGC